MRGSVTVTPPTVCRTPYFVTPLTLQSDAPALQPACLKQGHVLNTQQMQLARSESEMSALELPVWSQVVGTLSCRVNEYE